MPFSFRRSILDRETTYSLTGDALSIDDGRGAVTQVPLADVRSVNLQFNGRACDVDRYQCVVRTRRAKIALTNAHFVGLARFEPRDAAYRRFVLALHAALIPHASRIRFTQGSRLMHLTALLALTAVPLILGGLLMGMVLTGRFPERRLLGPVLGLPALLLMMLPVLKLGRPRPYSPEDVPEQYLPDSSG